MTWHTPRSGSPTIGYLFYFKKPDRRILVKTMGSIWWLLLVGGSTVIGWLVLGVLLCLPIITIPFAVQCFKFAGFNTVALRSGRGQGSWRALAVS